MSDQQDYADDQDQIPADQQDGDGEDQSEAEDQEQTTEEQGDDDPESDDTQDKPRKRRNRPGKTERELAQLRSQVDYLAQQLSQNRQGNGEQQAREPAKPKWEDYDDEGSYLDALAQHYADQKVREREQQSRRQSEQQRQQEYQRELAQGIERVNEAGYDKYDDYDDVALGDHWNPSQAMVEYIADSDHGADVAYHLGSHPDEAGKIARMSPVKAARELAKIERRFAQPERKQATKAPEPTKRLKGGRGGEPTDPDRMTTEQWMQWRAKQARG